MILEPPNDDDRGQLRAECKKKNGEDTVVTELSEEFVTAL